MVVDRKRTFSVLAVLGLAGMFFSEVLVWNAKLAAGIVYEKGAIAALVMALFTYFIYFLLVAVFCDTAVRYKAERPLEIILLGTIFGLINEGVFARVIFLNASPTGLNLPVMAFTSLFWHPFSGFFLSVSAVRYLLNNQYSIFSGRPLKAFETALVFSAGFLWHAMLFMPWSISNFPRGVPFFIKLTGFLFPALVFLIVRRFIKAADSPPAPLERLFSRSGLVFGRGIICLFAAARFVDLANAGNLRAAVSLLALALFYWSLFTLTVRASKRRADGGSLVEDSLYVRAVPRGPAFLKIWFIVWLAFAACDALSHFSYFTVFTHVLSRCLVAAALIFALAVPVYAMSVIIGNLLSGLKK